MRWRLSLWLCRSFCSRRACPGHPEKREQDYIRHGTRVLIASFIVPTGAVVGDLGRTRTSDDCAPHLLHGVERFRDWSRITWVMDNLNTHWSPQVCAVLALRNHLPFVPRSLRT